MMSQRHYQEALYYRRVHNRIDLLNLLQDAMHTVRTM